MGTLVFQANLGGAVNLIGPNTASTVNFTLPSADGTSGQALVTNGSGTLSFSTFTSGAAGSNTQVQFNSSGAFAGSANLTFDGTTLTSNALTVTNATTLSAGTANGVAYLNGSKVVTTGSALTYNGTNLGITGTTSDVKTVITATTGAPYTQYTNSGSTFYVGKENSAGTSFGVTAYSSVLFESANYPLVFAINSAEQMRLTSTGLGIGTSSPSVKLDVVGTAKFSGGGGYVSYGDNGYIRTDIANKLAFQVGTSGATWRNSGNSGDLMLLDNSGNLGLGVTPSAWASTHKALQMNWSAFSTDAGNGETSVSTNAFASAATTWNYRSTAPASRYTQDYFGKHIWFTAPSGTAGNAITFTQAMTLTAAGRLGLGLTSPSTLFEAYGGAAGTSSELTVGNASTAARFGVDTSNEVTVATGQAVPIKFLTSNTERARIDSSGNLLVGTSGSGFTSNVGIKMYPDGRMGCVVNDATTGTNSYHLYNTNATNNGYRFYVNVNGGINNYSANNVNLSDRREKTDFAPAGQYLAKICSIPVQTFKYIGQDDDALTLGVVAQDVEAVAPELVTEVNWGTEEEPKMRLSIYQTDLQYALMKCIQEQQAIIEQLKADVAELKGN